MRLSLTMYVLLLVFQDATALWQFWKRRHSDDGVLSGLLGLPSSCSLEGDLHSCTLSVTCWWSGGSSQSGCGTNPWLIACCVTKRQTRPSPEVKTTEISVSHLQRRNDILNTVNTQCGISRDRLFQKRIIGGKEAAFGQFPWQAYIKIASYQCGGVLVSKKFVATAAHCVLPVKLANLLVYLGEWDIEDLGQELAPAEMHRVKRKVLHPDFRFKATQPDRYDLALLELITDAVLGFHIVPICLPQKDVKLKGREALVAGWGKTDPFSEKSGTNRLRSVSVPILDINECMAWHETRQIAVELYPEMLCAGHKTGQRDACLGDSGGPLILLENGRWTLVGITSAGFGCGVPRQPGVYHNVPSSVDWIRSVISNNNNNKYRRK